MGIAGALPRAGWLPVRGRPAGVGGTAGAAESGPEFAGVETVSDIWHL